MAKQTIDLLGVLEEKTAGNLDAEEEQLMKLPRRLTIPNSVESASHNIV